MLEPRIETKSAIPLLGIPARFIVGTANDTTAPQVVGATWGSFNERIGEIAGVESGVTYGYSYYGPPETRSRPDEVEYVAGVEVAPGTEAPEGMVAIETAAGLYAVFEHRGVMWTFHDTLMAIYREWLPSSEFKGNGIGDVERYDSRWRPDSEDSVHEYWVGIEPRD